MIKKDTKINKKQKRQLVKILKISTVPQSNEEVRKSYNMLKKSKLSNNNKFTTFIVINLTAAEC